MQKLAGKIGRELKQHTVCAIYNSELARLWPPTMDPVKRKRQISSFARKHGLDVSFLDVGLCAIFEKKNKTKQTGQVESSRVRSGDAKTRRRART